MMPNIKKILYATDLRDHPTGHAFVYAVDMARKHDATIVILHCEEGARSISYAGSRVEAVVQEAKEEDQKGDLAEIRRRVEAFCSMAETQIGTPCAGLVSKILVPIGRPVEEILKAADEENCDLIVLGTHEKGFLEQTFLGSVAADVLEKTRKPLLIIPLPN
jgi:nucleotide-binding universal stress UspA family protein